ncbi:MAG TPA: DUF502 domain-containing protein [Planctomycetota bacterium]|nr:DUF502 domain-containing protein [Planctomycetota bacterium]
MAEQAQPRDDVAATYRRTFFRGLATLLPMVLTLWVFWSFYSFIDDKIASPITTRIKNVLIDTETGNAAAVAIFDLPRNLKKPVPQDGSEPARRLEILRKEDLRSYVNDKFPSWVGFLLAVVVVFIVGFFVVSFIGRTLWQLFEDAVIHIPIVKSIYPGAKQMVEFFLKSEESRRSWSSVVAVEYPRKGIWAIGYITGPGFEKIEERAGETMRTVFLPASPTMAGYVISVPEKDIVALDMTVDEAIRFTISGGVVRPGAKGASQKLKAV